MSLLLSCYGTQRLRWEGERQEQQGIGVATDLHRPICGGGGVRLISVAGLGVLGSLVFLALVLSA